MGTTDDLTDSEVIADPYRYFGRLREQDPVHRNETWGGWIITRYDDVEGCLRDDQHLSVERKTARLTEGPDGASRTGAVISRWMAFRDPPEHTRLRTLALEAFNSTAIEALRPDVERITRSLIEDIRQRDSSKVAFVREFAYLLPVRVICEMLGVPSGDSDRIRAWSRDIALTLLHFYGDADRRRKTEQSVREFSEYLRTLVRRRDENPQDDLITYLVRAQADGQMLDEDEVVATVLLLLFGGHETTMNLLANGIYELLEHPQQMELLRNDPSLVDGAVEEILRHQSPLKSLIRTAVEDHEFRGHRIEAGQRLMLSLAAANRDPRKFDDPEAFDITRDGTDHLAFGSGIHYCIGAPLARLEATIALPAFLDACPEIELATDEVTWRRSATVRGPEELPLRVSYA